MRLLPLFIPLVSAKTLGSWTISAFSRQCNPQDTSCTYTLTLNTTPRDSPTATDTDTDTDLHTCTFTVTNTPSAGDTHDVALARASKTDFSSIPCGGTSRTTGQQQRYALNGGWSDGDVKGGGFLTLVPTDLVRKECAFFGYGEGELAGGRVVGEREGEVYPVGGFGSSSSLGSRSDSDSDADGIGSGLGAGGVGVGGESNGERSVRVGEGMRGVRMVDMKTVLEGGLANMDGGKIERVGKRGAAGDRSQWQIKGLTRYPDIGANTTKWQFTVVDGAGKETHCSLAAPTSDPVGSFYGIPCGTDADANFKASWGYNDDADSAVMTVCFTPNGTDAWFGFEQVSHNQWLGDSKKEPVYYTGCA
ncbi:hypothetical protein C8A01DRAFT_40827 [Parachaetomium inaequale]|uniref:Uncharacterized protein n=1 Tax=Parachaetomium inaequale TaxID=2588326 RepID=A0AAN6P9E3_9PEZI|nr:hypothetical protein C8A01DRAFT_40827 [Parachaetomium inaequale]